MRSPTTTAWVRPPTDHGVDRPEMEARQRVKLTGTNRPRTYHNTTTNTHPLCNPQHTTTHPNTSIRLSVVTAERETPGPIPNPEAKPSSADGTAPDRMWESRTPPTPNQLAARPAMFGWAAFWLSRFV